MRDTRLDHDEQRDHPPAARPITCSLRWQSHRDEQHRPEAGRQAEVGGERGHRAAGAEYRRGVFDRPVQELVTQRASAAIPPTAPSGLEEQVGHRVRTLHLPEPQERQRDRWVEATAGSPFDR
jgi:hypothetical protein